MTYKPPFILIFFRFGRLFASSKNQAFRGSASRLHSFGTALPPLQSFPLLNSVHPCTLFNDKFFSRKTCCCMEPPPSVAVLKCTSLYKLMREFACSKLTSDYYHRHPWQVQKLTSLSIFEREFLHSKNIATAWNHGHPCPF